MDKDARRVGPGSTSRSGNFWEKCRDGGYGHPLDRVEVRTRRGNYSAFGGRRFRPSPYSEVICTACNTHWRTKARYVDNLKGA